MKKILTIASREYRSMVGTKAFLISIIMMPILMLGGLIGMQLMQKVESVKTRKLAIVDRSGFVFEQLESKIEDHNKNVRQTAKEADQETEPQDGTNAARRSVFGSSLELYELEEIDPKNFDDDRRLALSNRIRNQELYAFVEIPDEVSSTSLTDDRKVQFYSQDSSLSLARRWLANTLTLIVRDRRLADADISKSTLRKFQRLNQDVTIEGQGLLTVSTTGEIESTKEKDALSSLFLPMGVMMMMFMVIFMASQPMLESVLEEKSQRIAEVLLGSANPFQLMMGKLLGTVGGSLTIFGIYLLGGYGVCVYRGWTDMIPYELIPWFIVFQVIGVLFYASIFLAVGASVSQLKEAQSMLLPVWMMLMLPLFVWFVIVRDPLSGLATGFSLFPPATPTTMVLRMATGQTIPLWQPILGLVLTLLTTLVIVVLAGRIFRVGILWQGKTPKLGEILKWAIVGGN